MVAGRMIEGSAREIAEKITQMVGERHVRVMLMEDAQIAPASSLSDEQFEKEMAALRALAVSAPHADDSRESVYTRQPGE